MMQKGAAKQKKLVRGGFIPGEQASCATFAENCCTKNKKPLTMQGPYVFGAGNQWCDIR